MAVQAERQRSRPPMSPEDELEWLIAAQAADDTVYLSVRGGQVSLDAPVTNGDTGQVSSIGAEFVGRDPWELVDSTIDLGLDPSEVAFRGDLVDSVPRRGMLGGGLVDPRAVPHATAGGYQNHKCRCVPCTNAWAKYKRDRRAARRAS